MPKPRVYVETTIPNFYYDFRDDPEIVFRREATRRWWLTAMDRYELVTSRVVHDELGAGRSAAVPHRLRLLEPVLMLVSVPAINDIVTVYLENKLMPAKPPEDAVHLALASYHGCDFIVTWNCRHLANPNKIPHIRRINARLGLPVSSLVTPVELLKGASDV